MKKTLAIIGSAGTQAEFDFDREDCDIWVFNEAAGKSAWCKRADAVFQMHIPTVWRAKTNFHDPKHYEWLQNTDIPIYMMEHYDDVPASIAYPLEEVLKFLPRAQRYFTSSVAYAIALGIYKLYDRIEIYGVEMATNTEYGHQRFGVYYWLGVAAGKGVDIDFHSTTMFLEPLYGYEGNTKIEKEHYENRIKELTKLSVKTKEQYMDKLRDIGDKLDEYATDMHNGIENLKEAIAFIGKEAHQLGQYDAAKDLNENYLKKCEKQIEQTGDYFIHRQEYETNSMVSAREYHIVSTQQLEIARIMEDKRKRLLSSTSKFERREAIKQLRQVIYEYANITIKVGGNMGVGNESKMLMHILDMYTTALGGAKAVEAVLENSVGAR